MNCKKPFIRGVTPHGCGQCLPCRVNRRRLWTHRILLETLNHGDSSFVTLTYNDENLPNNGSLVPEDTQRFFKKLRARIAPRKIRYFLVGEYGDQSNRPHYHAAIFGLSPLEYSVVDDSWGLGFTLSGDLNKDSASYIAGYVTKKMTAKDDPRLEGRHPEFARMSLKPGIGADAIGPIVDACTKSHGIELIIREGDAPKSIKHGGKDWPLGRYLRSKIRKKIGDEEVIKRENYIRYAEEMQALRESSKVGEEVTFVPWRKRLEEMNQGRIASLEARFKIFDNKKGKL